MRIAVSLCGESVIDWKVDCADYLPDRKGYRPYWVTYEGDIKLGLGKERVCVLPKDRYRVFSGVCSCRESWADTIAVTR